jgi:DNA-binding PadR family transcriptional regulator
MSYCNRVGYIDDMETDKTMNDFQIHDEHESRPRDHAGRSRHGHGRFGTLEHEHGSGPGDPTGTGRRGRGRFGPFGPGDFGGSFRGGFGGRMRGPRSRRIPRGNVRAATLLLLAEQPRNGYQIMQEITERSKGVWSPSPGSVYPALQQLEDEGMVRSQETDGQRLYTLTELGKTYTEEHRTEFGSPWEDVSGAVGDDVHQLLSLMRQTIGATVQVAHAGSPAQVAKATQLMKETRQNLYKTLAEDEVEPNTSDPAASI